MINRIADTPTANLDNRCILEASEAILKISRPSRIRLFIIDGQPLIAIALAHLFAATNAFTVVGNLQSVDPAALIASAPDVVLLCQDHESMSVRDALAACRDAAPAAKICVLACHLHPESMPGIMEGGADALTVKDTTPTELVKAIIHIHDGGAHIDPRIGRYPPRMNASMRRTRKSDALSARETQVVRLIAEGRSNREISIALSLYRKKPSKTTSAGYSANSASARAHKPSFTRSKTASFNEIRTR